MNNEISLQQLQNRIKTIISADTNNFTELVELLDRNLLKDFSGAYLQNADFSRADLRSVDLSYSDLRNANFKNANLENANLQYSDLRKANFKGANLYGTNLKKSDLRESNLEDANLMQAKLNNADLRLAKLSGTLFSENSLSNTRRKVNKFKENYLDNVTPYLMEEFGYTNIYQVPKLYKILIHRGLGEVATDTKALESSIAEIAKITGQKPVLTRAKKAIAGFKIRQGMPVGVMVTLRGDRMYAFLDRFINISLPRIRDFRGLSPNSFDGRGNYSVGIREQLIFPEIEYDQIDQIRGMDISIITTANNDEQGRVLLKEMGMPFRDA